jgi:hypothetical protein
MAAFKPPGQCPACGEWVPRAAAACDDCGACAKSGWKANADTYDGLDLPDEDFDYDDFIQREFGGSSPGTRLGLSKETFWRIVAAVVLAVMILGYLLSAK